MPNKQKVLVKKRKKKKSFAKNVKKEKEVKIVKEKVSSKGKKQTNNLGKKTPLNSWRVNLAFAQPMSYVVSHMVAAD